MPDVAETLQGPDHWVTKQILEAVYRYELDLGDFFMGSQWEGNPFCDTNASLLGFSWCVRCSDTFDYATADAEEINLHNVETFVRVCDWAADCDQEVYAPLLFAALLRKRKPLRQLMEREGLTDDFFDELFEAGLE